MSTIKSAISSAMLLGLGLGLPLAAGGCMWTEFDDLKAETWVTATGKPDNDSANWGVAITRVARSGSGATLGVLGASEAIYANLEVGPNGDTNTVADLELNTQFAIGNLAVEPLLLSHPSADEAALVTALEANRVAVIRSIAGQLTAFGVTGLAQPSAATFMTSPPRPGDSGPATQVLIAQGDTVFGAFFDQTRAPNPQTNCKLVDDANAAVAIRALGSYKPSAGATSDDVLVLTDTGKLLAYPGTVFNGCMTPQAPKAGHVRDTMFMGAVSGSQIVKVADGDTTHVLVQAHNDSNKGRLALYRISGGAIEEVGAARDIDLLKTATLFEPGDTKRYVLAGIPQAVVEGVKAGQVQVIEVDLTSGISATPAMTLSDAQPEDNQAFGRGVAALPYNNKQIIAVAADNDVLLYFRTSMYGETREGR